MTNSEIIFDELVNRGLYTQTELEQLWEANRFPKYKTYASWKQDGYQVKKGSKAVFSCRLWKMTKGKKVEGETEEQAKQKEHFILVNSALFSEAQVEKIQ